MPIIGVIASSDRNVPGAPTIGTATNVPSGRAYNNGRADVTFTAPTYTGGRPITGYTVTSSPGGFTGTGASSPISVTGLQSNTAYTFTVTATNAIGTSAASAASNSITATTVPQAPTIGTATDLGTGTSVSVAFTANATGGSAITGFTATSSPSSITGTGASSPITVNGLTAGTAYTFTVTATNANGTSAASAASNSVTPQVPAVFESIATLSGTGSGATITFSSIPQTYKHLHLRIYFREASGGNNYGDINLRFNGSSAASYSWNCAAYNGSSITNGVTRNTSSGRGYSYGTGSGYSANHYGAGYFDITNYSSTDRYKVARGFSGIPTAPATYDGGLAYNSFDFEGSLSGITQIEIVNNNANAFDTNSRFYLYGIKDI